MGFLFGKKGKGIPQNATFRLTETGREKLQQFTGDAKSQILVALETNGTSDVEELAHAANMSKGQVERMLPALVKGGYVQYVSASGSDE